MSRSMKTRSPLFRSRRNRTSPFRPSPSLWSRLARNRWSIVNASDRPVGFAIEESLSRAFLRKVAGKFSRHYEANLHIEYHGKDVGTISRRGAEDVLELHGDID